MSPPRRAFLTGQGAVSALGRSVPELWQGLIDGRCGLGPLRSFDTTGLARPRGGEVPDEFAGDGQQRITATMAGAGAPAAPAATTLPGGLPASAGESILALTAEHGLDDLDRCHRHALRAAREALLDARLDPAGGMDRSRLAVVVGTTLGGMRIGEAWLASRGGDTRDSRTDSAMNAAMDAARLRHFPYFATATRLAQALGAGGPLRSPSLACASGTAAIVTAVELVRLGRADVVLAGGVEALSAFVIAGFDCLRATTAGAVRPFDRRRDGLLLGEGAGLVVIEAEEHARARGVRPTIEVAGGGLSTDAVHMTAPARDGAGAARAMRAALLDAGLEPAAVDFVSAHGTGTVYNDAMEAHAIARVLGARVAAVPVHSIKGAIGHTLAAAGALEAIVCAEVLRQGEIPPTVGCEQLDPACALDIVHGASRSAPVQVALSTSSAFAGHNAAIVLRREFRA